MRRKIEYSFGLCLLCLSLLLPGGNAVSSTTNEPPPTSIQKNTPYRESTYYNDTFDKLRDDIWKESRIMPRGPQMRPLMPYITSTDGKLKIETKTGDFCTGGLVSKYALRGDFDIQVDCYMDFLKKTPQMDQGVFFAVREKDKGDWGYIGLAKRDGHKSVIVSRYWGNGKALSPKRHPVGDFHGTLRIVRTGNKITTSYRKERETEWEKLLTFQGMTGEVVLGFELKNFLRKRTSIQARLPFAASFDNFRINAAQEVIEEIAPSVVTTDCDKALSLFWEGWLVSEKEDAYRYYMEAIDLCPGFIRPYELVGNYFRKEGKSEKAIEFFTKAADLGSANYKLYYLLAGLFFQEGDFDEAGRYLNKSLDIRGDYPRSLALKSKIEKERDTSGPKIILYEPSTRRGLNLVSQNQNISVRGIATDKSGVSWVKVNKMDTPVDKHGNFLKDVPIEVGTNTIVVEAADRLGNQSTLSVTIEGKEYTLPPLTKVETPSQEKDLYGKSFAVVIGINSYEKWPPLEFAVNDAKAITKRLKETGFDHITVILDKEATQRRILTELFHELPKKVGLNDRLFFYFAGHGQTEDLPKGGKRGYIIPVDGDVSNYGATAISMDQIKSLSSRIPAKHILYAMDSCYSGLGLNRSGGVSPEVSDYLRKISSMRVVQIITAGGKGEQVQEKGSHGLFTTYFLRALGGEADFNKDNVVTGTELGAYLRPTVSNASGQAQTPLYGRLEGEGEFLFFVGKK